MRGTEPGSVPPLDLEDVLEEFPGALFLGIGEDFFRAALLDDLADALVHLMKYYSDEPHLNVGTGNDVTLTINSSLQWYAQNALAQRITFSPVRFVSYQFKLREQPLEPFYRLACVVCTAVIDNDNLVFPSPPGEIFRDLSQ